MLIERLMEDRFFVSCDACGDFLDDSTSGNLMRSTESCS